MYELNPIDEISRAEKVLEKMKQYEKKTKLHRLQINDRTVVYCKNEHRLEEYKKVLK